MNNKTFWKEQSKQTGVNAVNFDKNMHILENKAIEPHIKGCGSVLDLGCGNGLTTNHLAMCYPETQFTGIDSDAGMIKQANADKPKNVVYKHMDAIKLLYPNRFDAVIGKRLLINVMLDNDRRKIIDNIEVSLKDGGKYIMVENFIEPLNRINKLREIIGSASIRVHDFNKYLNNDFIKIVERNELYLIKTIDFGSLYYFISRVFNPAGKYDSNINNDSVKLSLAGKSNIIQGYCPELMLIFKKKTDNILVGGSGYE